jgi:hypothetical protein
MADDFNRQINEALGLDLADDIKVVQRGSGELYACFRVSDMAEAAVTAATRELAALLGARDISIDRRLCLLWFGMSLRPSGWSLPSAWDPLAGDYQAADGWIRLHTNANHHREAALRVLNCDADKARLTEVIADWKKNDLEDAVVNEGGAAAAMHSLAEWANHPQGQQVHSEPLIDWHQSGYGPKLSGLRGRRVLDLTRILAGPVATRFLAGFGADVLRLDPPNWHEPALEPEVTLGKRRAGLDLHLAHDRQIFERLIAQADVLVHGYRPGALDRLGYDTETRQRLSPGLIEVSLNAYGWGGAWKERRGFDSLVQMSCGIADEGMRRAKDTKPVPLPVQALDHATGYLMAAAVLRALRHCQLTGDRLSARLSLARTAGLLVDGGVHDFHGNPINDTADDLCHAMETTSWGPAKRLKFPASVDGKPPEWPRPAGLLRVDDARW